MADGFRTRLARFDWVDYTAIRITPSPTKHSKVTAAVKKENQSWTSRQQSTAKPQIYVRKTVCINGDILKGRDIPREYETWSSLGNHPHVLACEDFQCMASSQALDEATFWSEYCEMGDLGQFISMNGSRHRSLSLPQGQQIVYQISSALAFIHYGLYITLDAVGSVEELELFDHPTLIHRDIKPQNIFISRLETDQNDGSQKIHVKLGDFGCAKQLDDDTSMSDTGTIRYKAPESRCVSSSGHFQRPTASVKSDIWSFGATMRDVMNYLPMPDLFEQCCLDDATKRPSSVQILEKLQQHMKPEHDISPIIREALYNDTDSTFWDLLLIERILEASANPNVVEFGALTYLRMIAATSNKSDKDAEVVYQLLLRYGASPKNESSSPEITISAEVDLPLEPELGGEASGTHPEPAVARSARELRRIPPCWHCSFQRYLCSPGDICQRCLERMQRPNADLSLVCIRTKLIDLITYLLPASVMLIHEESHIKSLVATHVQAWSTQPRQLYLTFHLDRRDPVFFAEVDEFIPTKVESKSSLQVEKIISPPLAMIRVIKTQEKHYDRHLSAIVDESFHSVSRCIWKGEDDVFQKTILRLMKKLEPRIDEEARVRNNVLQLILCTSCMSNPLWYDDDLVFTSSHILSRQLQFFFARIQHRILSYSLHKLHRIFSFSKDCDDWVLAFILVVGLAMTTEIQQKHIHRVLHARVCSGELGEEEARSEARKACMEIETRVYFVIQLFRWKYNRHWNPIRDPRELRSEVGFKNQSSANFILKIGILVRENIVFLQQRQMTSVEKALNEADLTLFTSRHVAKFLLSFWLLDP